MHSINTTLLEPAPASERTASSAEAGYVLNVTMVYQDLATRDWATEMWGRVAQLVGQESINAASWKISDLARPGILAEAVESAARADVVVAAVSAAEELPSDLYVWFDIWLPRRTRSTGALVALIGLPEAASHQSSHAQEYFQSVARKGRLDYFPQKRLLPVLAPSLFPRWFGLDYFPQGQTLPAASPDLFNLGAIAESADARRSVHAGVVGGGDNFVYQHGGINE